MYIFKHLRKYNCREPELYFIETELDDKRSGNKQLNLEQKYYLRICRLTTLNNKD